METVSSDLLVSINIENPPFSVWWLVFLLAVGVFAILSAILLYHWREYALEKHIIKKVTRVYFIVSGSFILLLAVSLLLTQLLNTSL